MFEPLLMTGSVNEIYVTNISECESNSEEIDRVLGNMKLSDNFAFHDSMELVEI